MRRMFTEAQVKKMAGEKIDQVVPAMIETGIDGDKDVLSQITIEYDSEAEITIVSFPNYILPLKLIEEGEYGTLYFDYENEYVLDNTNSICGNISITNNKVELVFQGNIELEITSLTYCLFNDDEAKLNTYYLFNPAKINYSTNEILVIVNQMALTDGDDFDVALSNFSFIASDVDLNDNPTMDDLFTHCNANGMINAIGEISGNLSMGSIGYISGSYKFSNNTGLSIDTISADVIDLSTGHVAYYEV